jgi:hypothetical protein
MHTHNGYIAISRAISVISTLGLLAVTASCALGPVETDPVKAEQRAAAMRDDCYARGGTWSSDVRTCVGADPRR